MSNDLLAELKSLNDSMKIFEDEALKHEAAARECRTKRSEAKARIAELQGLIEYARVVHAINGSLASAQAAQFAAEQSKAEASAVLDVLKAKQAELDALLAKLSSPPENDLK